MKKDPLVYIDDIRDSIEAIKRYTAGLTKEDFFNSTEKQDAVYRRLEVIGEAANRLPDEFRNQYSQIPLRSFSIILSPITFISRTNSERLDNLVRKDGISPSANMRSSP